MEHLVKLLLLQCLLIGHVTSWVNEYNMPFNFTCPSGTSLVHVVSDHDNIDEDRIWEFSCRAQSNHGMTMTNCAWSDYANDFDKPLTYQCPGNGIIAGISSYHDNFYEDRRFMFKCCEIPGYATATCSFTDYVNKWDEHMDYILPAKKVMRGVDSYHDNFYEDRRFKFEICDLISV